MARLPQVTGKRLVRALVHLGWSMHHQRGSHVYLTHPERAGVLVTIPCHPKPITKGTLAAILRDVGLTGDELRALL